MSKPTPASIASTVMSWVNDPSVSAERLESKTAALVELYGRDLLREYRNLGVEQEFATAEETIYKSLKTLYDPDVSDRDKILRVRQALSNYVSGLDDT